VTYFHLLRLQQRPRSVAERGRGLSGGPERLLMQPFKEALYRELIFAFCQQAKAAGTDALG